MSRPLTILLGEELYCRDEVVAALVGAGHTVKCLRTEDDSLIMSTKAWRIPGDGKKIPDDEMLKYISTAIAQIRAVVYTKDTKEKKESAKKKPAKSAS